MRTHQWARTGRSHKSPVGGGSFAGASYAQRRRPQARLTRLGLLFYRSALTPSLLGRRTCAFQKEGDKMVLEAVMIVMDK